jgi:hypothetical protein
MKFILPLPFWKASSAGAETCSAKPDYKFPAAGVLRPDLAHPDQEV